MANRRFQKTFILSNVGTKFITTNTVKPNQLTAGQMGFHLVDQFEVVGVGTGATPGATVPAIQIHQNLGDNNFGTIRSKTIQRSMVRNYYSSHASTGQTEIWYIGYDTVDATKDILVGFEKDIQIRFHVWDKKLARWYNNNPGFNKNIIYNTGLQPAGNTTGLADQDTVANALVALINSTNSPVGDYKAGNELPNYVLATKVTTGTPGTAGYHVGVKVETLVKTQALINLCDPIKFYEVELTTIDVQLINSQDLTVQIPVTKAQGATSGNGYPAEAAALEAESQGFDRVREVFENKRYMKNSDYILNSVDGGQYDYIYLDYDWLHNTGAYGASHGQLTEKYSVIIGGLTTTLQPVADVLNSWLTGLWPAVTI